MARFVTIGDYATGHEIWVNLDELVMAGFTADEVRLVLRNGETGVVKMTKQSQIEDLKVRLKKMMAEQ